MHGVFMEVAETYAPTKRVKRSVVDEISMRYAQVVDPTQTQIGESVYDEADDEYLVVENDPTTTEVVLMPKDQVQQPVPQGVKTVDEAEMGTYTIQPTAGQPVAKRAQQDIDWDDIQSAAIDVVAYSRQQDAKGIIEALDYLNFLILDQVQVEEGVDMRSMFARIGRKQSDTEILAEFEKEVEMEVEDVEDIEELGPGESGYTDIMHDIKTMVAEEIPVVDLVLAIGEKYPRSMGEKVLADARSRGIL